MGNRGRRNRRGSSTREDAAATILVVDDKRSVRALCQRTLAGYRVLLAETCREALELYRQERVDLVLTDVKMPGDDGIVLLGKLKQLDPTALVVIMTGYAENEVVLASLKEGADDFITKPFEPLCLRKTVEKVLVAKKLREELADLRKLERLKDDFLSIVSHKLRTPITSITLALEVLQGAARDVRLPEGEGLVRDIRQIRNEVAYLERLVSDLLRFTRISLEEERLSPEPCDLAGIVEQALQTSPEAQRKPEMETSFRAAHLPPMMLDREKISFAIQQVIDNAYKFSSGTGRVAVTLRRQGERVHLVVSDSGVGIPSGELCKVMKKFYQVDPEKTGQVRGLGLGLYYAREFVRQHDGTLAVESEQGQGTTVTIMLPLQ